MEIVYKGPLNRPTTIKLHQIKKKMTNNHFSALTEESPSLIESLPTMAPIHDPSFVESLFLAIESYRTPDEQEFIRGGLLLDHLDAIKKGLICGEVSPVLLTTLSELSTKSSGFIDDPALKEIILEIETRARVEMAKLMFVKEHHNRAHSTY